MRHNFKWYLHEYGTKEEIAEDLSGGYGIPAEVANFIAQTRPFYEIELDCSFDDLTQTLTYQVCQSERLTSA